MSIILGFAPFIVFFVLASFISPLAGLGSAFAISLVMSGLNWQRGKSFKILDVGSLVLFGATALCMLSAMPDLTANTVRLIVNGGLTLMALVSLAIGQPFTLQYAKERIPEQYWTAPLFIRTNQLITIVWTLAFAIGTAATATSIYLRAVPNWLEIAVAVGGLTVAVWFTSWYPARVRERRSRSGIV
jgi:hypothetical protein